MVSQNATGGERPMKTKVCVSVLVVLFSCLVGWTGHARAQRSSQERQAWEYKVFSPVVAGPTLQDQMDQLGIQGWELVAVEHDGGLPHYPFVYYFKRAK
jgi:hypothetical protein